MKETQKNVVNVQQGGASSRHSRLVKGIALALVLGVGGLASQAQAAPEVLGKGGMVVDWGSGSDTASVSGSFAIAGGRQAHADSQGVTLGNQAGVGTQSYGAVYIGSGAGKNQTTNTVNYRYGVAVGYEAGREATGEDNAAYGRAAGADVKGEGNVAFGAEAGRATVGNYNVGIGASSGGKINGKNNISMGYYAGGRVDGNDNVFIGTKAGHSAEYTRADNVKLNQAISIGAESVVTENKNIAMGYKAESKGAGSIVFGAESSTDKANAVVLGNNITTTEANSVFFGNKAAYVEAGTTTKGIAKDYTTMTVAEKTKNIAGGDKVVGVVSVGSTEETRRIQNVAPGLVSADSTDAINGSQLQAVIDEIGGNTNAIAEDVTTNTEAIKDNTQAINDNAKAIGETAKAVDSNTQAIADNRNRINKLDEESREGDAMAAALAALKPVAYNPQEPTQIMAGVGTYRGKTAAALGAAHYVNGRTMFNGGVAFGANSHVMANLGVTWRVGSGAVPEDTAAGAQQEVASLNQRVQSLEKLVADQKAQMEQQQKQMEALLARLG